MSARRSLTIDLTPRSEISVRLKAKTEPRWANLKLETSEISNVKLLFILRNRLNSVQLSNTSEVSGDVRTKTKLTVPIQTKVGISSGNSEFRLQGRPRECLG